MSVSPLSVPHVFGPGYWKAIHVLAIKADTIPKQHISFSSIKDLISGLLCGDCLKHATEYVEKNPFKINIRNHSKDSLFVWTVNFHNVVNKRLGKKIISIDEAKKIFSDEGFCEHDCGDKEESNDFHKNVSFLRYTSKYTMNRMV